MASVNIDGSDVVVRLSTLEKLGAFHGDVRIPLLAITGVRVTENPWSELRGMRFPGTGFPGVIALCTLRGRGIHDFAAVYGKRPGVVIDAQGADFERVTVTCDDPQTVVDRITAARNGSAR
ncbi:PH domain-containing protein [Nocardia stercoris]|uniref:Uncharacterized protein n=1 Tax=Nocardia stercoris TaxID=2483361 RepID=A0A3M2L7Z1_9NOCA|nr:hypothetical protein [Nocardia stercoris]RMI30658.1 hypothetical protein EBN03_21650 [Nocardia stercoris]